jgi:hypothetical protein
MNVLRQMNLAKVYGELWDALFPSLGKLEFDQLALWAGTYTEKQVVTGMNRAARKARKLRDTATPMSLPDVIRYASSVMKNEKCGFRDFTGRRTFHGTQADGGCGIPGTPSEGQQ